jgi:hypothetical protein
MRFAMLTCPHDDGDDVAKPVEHSKTNCTSTTAFAGVTFKAHSCVNHVGQGSIMTRKKFWLVLDSGFGRAYLDVR